jgi:hypothetical protein
MKKPSEKPFHFTGGIEFAKNTIRQAGAQPRGFRFLWCG